MSTLAGYGEDPLVAALVARLPEVVRTGGGVIAGIGDDCAVIRTHEGATTWQLLKTDCVAEGVHYLPDTPPEKVGWKAMCRPLSDIAAMGGRPLHALVTVLLPETTTVEYAKRLYDGLGRAAERFGVKIVGGETARSPTAGMISVALTGEVDAAHLATRSGGKSGDLIFVTGKLGGSFPSGKHLDFVPRLAEAHWLVSQFAVSAMMDLSDGLARDLARLAQASGTGYRIDHSLLPVSPGCNARQALGDGEDYELLFTICPTEAESLCVKWSENWPALTLTCVGELINNTEPDNMTGTEGYDHFKPAVSR